MELRDIKYLRLAAVALLVLAAFLPRLASLGTILTVDENIWRGRGEQFIKALASSHFDKTLVAGQPGVTTAWLVGLSLPWSSLASAQAAIALATGVLVLLTTYGLARLWGFWWGVAGGFFLALDPFLIAHSRLVHTDALFALFYLASLVWLLLALEQVWHIGHPTRRYVVMSGILGGLSLLTKIFTAILIPTVACIFLLYAWHSHKHASNIFRAAVVWLATAVLTTFALWPALWTAPEQVAQYLTGRATLHVSEGTHAGETTATWWYYGRESIFRLTAITTLLLMPAAVTAVKARDRMRRVALALLAAGTLFAIVLSLSSEKSDRYILISVLTLDLFAVLGLRQVSEWITRHRQPSHPSFKNMAGWIAVVTIAFLALGTAKIHPYYLAHHNALYPVEERHKLGWGEGLEQAAEWIQGQGHSGKIASYYAGVMKHWYPGPVEPLNHAEETNTKYIVLYRSMFERGEGHRDTEMVAEYLDNPTREPIHTIFINRLPYIWIFERK